MLKPERNRTYYEVLKSGETINGDRYRQQFINLNRSLRKKQSEWNMIGDTVKMLKLDLPPHSPALALSSFHALRSMAHELAAYT